jgi:hypothetical protein
MEEVEGLRFYAEKRARSTTRIYLVQDLPEGESTVAYSFPLQDVEGLELDEIEESLDELDPGEEEYPGLIGQGESKRPEGPRDPHPEEMTQEVDWEDSFVPTDNGDDSE